METKKLLLLIDCQYDFIDGSLAVVGATAAMDSLAEYIQKHGSEYAAIAATLDWHPADHCSFKGMSKNGIWPVHCVQHTLGAALYDPIAQCAPMQIQFFTKGNIVDKEEYSIFANDVNGARLADMIRNEGYTQIDVCGLCGDYCVKESVAGLIKHGFGKLVNILWPYTPSIDGGDTLTDFVEENDIHVTE